MAPDRRRRRRPEQPRQAGSDRREFLRWVGGVAAATLPCAAVRCATQGAVAQLDALAGDPAPRDGGGVDLRRVRGGAAALVYDARYKDHDPGSYHPEHASRCDAVIHGLVAAGLHARLIEVAPRPATDQELQRCHDRAYIELVAREVAAGRTSLSTGDTSICAESLDVARLAAGGVLAAVDAVFDGTARTAFCVVRPPGHHATPDRGMGFCIFNNVALGARHAQQVHGIGRVAVVDWDVHHGNGTQDMFWEDGSVFYFSSHQQGIFPGTGHPDETGVGAGAGTTLNCPVPAGSGRQQILVEAVEGKLLPALERFRPELLLLSAGFDSRTGDTLGDLELTDADFADLTRHVMRIAQAHAGGRVVSVLEGGYELDGLGKAAAAHVSALLDG